MPVLQGVYACRTDVQQSTPTRLHQYASFLRLPALLCQGNALSGLSEEVWGMRRCANTGCGRTAIDDMGECGWGGLERIQPDTLLFLVFEGEFVFKDAVVRIVIKLIGRINGVWSRLVGGASGGPGTGYIRTGRSVRTVLFWTREFSVCSCPSVSA